MAIVCPTVTPYDPHQYREQLDRVATFADRIHIDFMDGEFVETQSPPLDQAWWPAGKQIDLHLMYKHPFEVLDKAISLKPQLIIIHAEAENLQVSIEKIKNSGIKVGLALLAPTPASACFELIEKLDYALIFSGSLGHFGGHADLSLLSKAQELKDKKPSLEIGWDGGINSQNAKQLVDGGVDVLNVGGFIQRDENPLEAFGKLRAIIS